jgi:hypothetical protein
MQRVSVLSFVIAACVLSGCAGSETAAVPSNAAVPAMGKTEIAQAKKSSAFLYAVNREDYQVDVFTYPQGEAVGDIRYDFWVSGSCSGIDGAVWVAYGNYNDHAMRVDEFARGATTPETTIAGPGENPLGCSQDAKTHDLAVATTGGEEDKALLAVFPDAPRYAPVSYTPISDATYEFCAYDGNGNLFVNGIEGSERSFFLIELKKGQKKFTTITTDRTFESPGGMVWFKGSLLMADGSGTSIYRMLLSGKKAKTIETATLDKAAYLDYQFGFHNNQIVASPSVNSSQPYGISYWKFPLGGQPKDFFGQGASYSSYTVTP